MEVLKLLSAYAIPAVFLVILSAGIINDVKVYDVFVEGAKEGISTVARIIPSLVGLLVAVGVFRASGALDLIIYAVRPAAELLGIPSEALPLAFLRPISGSASLALVSDIIKTYGPDSFTGRLASTMMGSTETIFYTLAVYFGAVGIKNIRYTLAAALIADCAGVLASVWICTALFGSYVK
ncbi:MAG: spore maturation protein [Clostridia bacterium]|nr:spore maturation protein [Clostridia bacterium]